MLNLEEFDRLEIGDQVETRGLFSKVDPEPVVMRLDKRTDTMLEFVVTYFGVTLGRWKCSKNGEALSWAT
jgi:hypothetical protein